MRQQHQELLEQSAIPMDPAAFSRDVFNADITDIAHENKALDAATRAAHERIDVEGIIALTARLSQVLAQEVEYLADMQIKELEGLQKEKTQLLDALESQKRHIDTHPHLLALLTDDDCLELAQIIEIFQGIMKENHRRLLIAREVNLKVTEAIINAVNEDAKTASYTHEGSAGKSKESISMTVDRSV
jgi:flagellar biosynthesis/type III secretory pathway chaperone